MQTNFELIKQNVTFTNAKRKLLLYQNLILSILLYCCFYRYPSQNYKLKKFKLSLSRFANLIPKNEVGLSDALEND